MNAKNNLTYCFLIIFSGLIGQSKVISPIADTYISQSDPEQDFGSNPNLLVKHSVSNSNERMSFIKFDLKNLKYSKQIFLKLVKTGGDMGNIRIDKLENNENFNKINTWNSIASSKTNPLTFAGIREENLLLFDVTSLVNYRIQNNIASIVFRISSMNAVSKPITFGSLDNNDLRKRPEMLLYSEEQYKVSKYGFLADQKVNFKKRGSYTIETLNDHSNENQKNQYGGLATIATTSTGFFRTEKDCKNTWQLIDPDGNLFYSVGLNSIETGGGIKLPEALTDMGVNTMGSWSDESIKKMPYCPKLNMLSAFKNTNPDLKAQYKNNIIPVFEPNFYAFCKQRATDLISKYINDKWVLGYFMDNELPFYKNQLSPSLSLSKNSPQYKSAKTYMTRTYGTNFSTSNITGTDELRYQDIVLEEYMKIVSRAIKEVDPNHLLLGTRFHGTAKKLNSFLRISGKYLDVISINYYSSFEPEEDLMEMWVRESDKPFMITEFYTKGDDTGLGNGNGAGWVVNTQEDRAKWFENWILKLVKTNGNIGFHWFRYIDNNDTNKGVYDENHKPYAPLYNAFKKINKSIYSLRSHMLFGNQNYNEVTNCVDYFCELSENCKNNLSVIESPTDALKFEIYPNPSTGFFTLSKKTTWSVYNLLGKNMQSGTEKSIDLSRYPTGIYMLKTKQGTKKLIVK